jgi:pilus assembly protein CpaF
MIKIRIKEKGGGEQVLTFDRDTVNIGRVRGNDIVLPRPNISKRHARVVVNEGEIYVIDLKSTNGTYVNGNRISAPFKVSGPDKVFMGDFMLKVEKFIEEEAIIPDEQLEAVDEYYEPPEPPKDLEKGAREAMRFMEDEVPPPVEPSQVSPAIPVGTPVPAAPADFEELQLTPEAPLDEPPPVQRRATSRQVPPPQVEEELEETSAMPLEEAQKLLADLGRPATAPQQAPAPRTEPGPGPLSRLEPVSRLGAEAAEVPPPAPPAFEAPPDAPPPVRPVEKAAPARPEGRATVQAMGAVGIPQVARPTTSVGGVMPRPEVEAVSVRLESVSVEPPVGVDPEREAAVEDLVRALSEEVDLYQDRLPEVDLHRVASQVHAAFPAPDEAVFAANLVSDLTGLGPVEDFLKGGAWEEMHASGPFSVTVTLGRSLAPFTRTFASRASYAVVLERIVRGRWGHELGDARVFTGTLTGNENVAIHLGAFTAADAVLYVTRRLRPSESLLRWVERNVLDEVMAEHLTRVVMRGENVLVLGREPLLREGILESLALAVPRERKVALVQDRPHVRLPHGRVLPVARVEAEEDRELVESALSRFRPEALVLPDLSLTDTVRWLPWLLDEGWSTLASASGESLESFRARVALRLNAEGYDWEGSFVDRLVGVGFRHVVLVRTYPCGTAKVVGIKEWLELGDGAGQLVPRFLFKEDRLSPDGKIIGHFEKAS